MIQFIRAFFRAAIEHFARLAAANDDLAKPIKQARQDLERIGRIVNQAEAMIRDCHRRRDTMGYLAACGLYIQSREDFRNCTALLEHSMEKYQKATSELHVAEIELRHISGTL